MSDLMGSNNAYSMQASNLIGEKKEYNFYDLLPYDVHTYILSYLDVFSLISLSECSLFMHAISSDCNTWSHNCELLWRDKTFISKDARESLKCRSFIERDYCKKAKLSLDIDCNHDKTFCQCCKQAYKYSFIDSFRHEIKKEELCNFAWSFRFKESAGSEWMQRDPWWNFEKARKVVFLPDGRVLQIVQSETKNNNDKKRKQAHEEIARKYRLASVQNVFSGKSDCSETLLDQTVIWKFIAAPLDLPHRDIGGYIRISICDREIPAYVVRRSPTNNWGFVIENCWGVFSSFEMPLKDETIALEDTNLLMASSWQWKEALCYNMGKNIELERTTKEETYSEL